jgi:hypothetical protein
MGNVSAAGIIDIFLFIEPVRKEVSGGPDFW